MRIPLGGSEKSYNSKRSRQSLINLIFENDKGGEFRTIKRTEGLTELVDLGNGPIRSDILINSGFAYLVSGGNFFRFDSSLTVENLGPISGAGRAKLSANSFQDIGGTADNQIFILNGSGSGFTFKNADGLELVTDTEFFPSSSVAILNERFWFPRDGTNEFFGSDSTDGKSYNALTVGTADEKPDNVVGVVAKRSALWVLGEKSVEYWQSRPSDPTFPLRRIAGATIERGCISVDSIAEQEDSFAWLADDSTVRMISGNQMVKISDLELELKIKGDGTLTNPGFSLSDLESAFAFWLDGPIHKVYCLTFADQGYTWCWDQNTGGAHLRESIISFSTIGRWRANSVGNFEGKIIVGDFALGRIWTLDPAAMTEGDEIQITRLRTPSITMEQNFTLPLLEVDMETGIGLNTGQGSDPLMMVAYSKDGTTFIQKSSVSLGKIGNHRQRVPIREFGRVVRNKDFILELSTSDPIRIQYYALYGYPKVSAW